MPSTSVLTPGSCCRPTWWRSANRCPRWQRRLDPDGLSPVTPAVADACLSRASRASAQRVGRRVAEESAGGTRERIEQTALRLFRDRGFDKVTIEEICRAASVAPATFYRQFG